MEQRNILIIEDDPNMLETLVEYIEDHSGDRFDLNLKTTSSIEKAQKHLGEERFDLILLDLNLDDGHGNNVLDYLEKMENHPKTIVFSGAIEEHNNSTIDDVFFISKTQINRLSFLLKLNL